MADEISTVIDCLNDAAIAFHLGRPGDAGPAKSCPEERSGEQGKASRK
jgi:hypothetical protein